MSNPQDFLPEDFVERKLAQRTNIICASLFVVVLVAVVGAFFVTNAQRDETRDRLLAVNRQFEQKAAEIRQIEQLQQQKDALLRKAGIISHLVEPVPRSVILSEVVNHMPTSLSWLSLELETEIVQAPRARTALEKAKTEAKKKAEAAADNQPAFEAPPKRITLEIKGVSPTHKDVANYQAKLLASPMFSSVSLGGIEQRKIDDRELLQFRLELELDTTADLTQYEPARVARRPVQDPLSDQVGIDAQGQFGPPTSSVAAP
ncbi:MAG: PilN domain-containing protein [Planctomycetota bacterium]